MTKRLHLWVCLLLPFCFYSQVVINEVDADTPGLDVLEIIELKSETPYFALDGYILVLFNGGSGSGTLSYYTIDLNGLVTDGNGIVLLGNSQVNPSPSRLFPQNTVQNGPDAIAIYQDVIDTFPIDTPATTTNLIDALIYGNNATQATALQNALNIFVQTNENANGLAASQSIQRKNDGTYEVKAPTPRANNDGSGIVYNGIEVITSTSLVNEGESVTISFETDTPVAETLNFTLNLNNGTFTTADFTGNLSLTIPMGSSSASTQIQVTNDGINDGDEEMSIVVGSLPEGYITLNNSVIVRVLDVNFQESDWGTPMVPTFGNVNSTAPAGYYDSLEGLSGAALKQAVQDIIADPNVVRAHSYGDVVEILFNADQNPANNNQVWLMYVERPQTKIDYQTGASIVGFWNREHIWPQSRGGFSGGTSSFPDGIDIWLPTNADDILTGHSDAHHLRAEDGQENSSRGNRDYGLSDYNGPNGNVGSWKGDVARSLFYMAVRYNGLNLVNGNPPDNTMGQMGDLASLLTWNETDPSDDFEMNRNNYIYTWQMNRNPFIDYPELANYIFGSNFGDQWFAPLSLEDNNFSDVKVYPIPAKDEINISGIENDANVTIFSLEGVQVYQSKINGFTQLNLNLASGMYLMNIETDNQKLTKKIIIK
ncbi:MAG TPA: endonuclease [Flavobacterium sp.]|uniref:endonuclease n=1 Tax=unclassified Flavobacterium TaxID=196869 RepID=UPI000E933856|nr:MULTISPECIES: endonuclease [unclassified Flavobacterium]HBI00600.1 ribonuclease [Flavobacterium sp.]HRE78942.1 endonuclease [Flavobacterium sp.]